MRLLVGQKHKEPSYRSEAANLFRCLN